MCIKMVNFNIIEGVDTFDGIKDEFLRMYLDGVKVNDIKKKFGLTHAQYLNYLKRLRRSGEVKQVRAPWAGARKPPRQAPRNYTFNKGNNHFIVTYKETYYTCFKKERQAQRFVELMRECDLDMSCKDELRQRVLREDYKNG